MMSHIKSALFLLICFALGIGAAKLFMNWRGHGVFDSSPKTQSTAKPPALHGFLLPIGAVAKDLDPLAALHTNAVALEYAGDKDALHAIAKHAHTLGMRLTVTPPRKFSRQSPYGRPVSAVATEAAAAGADALVVSWLDSDSESAYWRPEIQKARDNFKGEIILAATASVIPQLDFLDATDVIGIIGPVELPRRLPHAAVEINVHDLRVGWACYLDALESIGLKNGKHLALLDMTVPPAPATKIPLTAADAPHVDPELQAIAYEALLLETRGRNLTSGIYLRWQPGPTPQSIASDPLAANHLPLLLGKIATLWAPGAKVEPETTPASQAWADDADPPETDP